LPATAELTVFTLSAFGLLVAVGIALAGLAATRKLSFGHWLAVSIFAVYLVGVAHFVLLPLVFDPRAPAEFGPIDLGRLIELRPFFLPGGDVMPTSQVGLNILLTVPFGFGLPFVAGLRGREVLAIGVLLSVGIELAQLLADALYLALPTWSVDINDVFLNSLGVVLGLAVFQVMRAVYAATVGRLPVRHGPWAYFHDTLVGPRT
jgi:glycopeptide antibiotics resistance protein